MARIFPNDYGAALLSAGQQAELATLEELRRDLPDDFSIYHSVHWAKESRYGTAVGEIDFAVVNQAGDILLVEQKAGDLEETSAGLTKTYADGPHAVADQVHRSINQLQDKFRATLGERPSLDYLVYLPHYRVEDVNAAGLGAERLVHAGSDDTLSRRITAVLGTGRPDPDRARRVRDFFAQTLRLVPSVDRTLSSHDQVFTQLAEGLARVGDRLEMAPWRVRVIARAGSGKSQLAVQVLEQAQVTGRRALYVCFNRALAEQMEEVAAGAAVHTFHDLCRTVLEAAGEPFEAAERGHDPAFWQELEQRVADHLVDQAPRFDTVVVDEGQDFKREWYEILRLCAVPDADILWLEDPLQDLFARGSPFEAQTEEDDVSHAAGEDIAGRDGYITWRTLENHRSPRHITRYIERHLGITLESQNDLPGDPVEEITYTDATDQSEQVAGHIDLLLARGFRSDQIVLLTVHGHDKSPFSSCEWVGAHRLQRFVGHRPDGHQALTPGEVVFDSVYRYKGRQSSAVILVDVDFSDWHHERNRRVLYTGMTRAAVHLCIARRVAG